MPGVVSDDKSRPPDLGHYFIADAADVILGVDAERPKTGGTYPRMEAVQPGVTQRVVEPHCDETLRGIRPAGAQRLRGQQSFHRKGPSPSIVLRAEVTVVMQDFS